MDWHLEQVLTAVMKKPTLLLNADERGRAARAG